MSDAASDRARQDRLLALLFASGDPVPLDEAARWLDLEVDALPDLLEAALRRLSDLPWTIRRAAGGIRLVLVPGLTDWVAANQGARGPETFSHALWECLAVVAYRQPITRLEVDELRQVRSDYALDTLAQRGLIQEVGRKATPGRPILYGTTPGFLEMLGLDSLEQLPPPPNAGPAPPTEGQAPSDGVEAE